MKQKLPLLLFIVSTLIFGSCAKDFLLKDTFFSSDESVNDAREQFEANATDLCEVHFGMTVGQSKTKANSKTVITPLWNKGKVFQYFKDSYDTNSLCPITCKF